MRNHICLIVAMSAAVAGCRGRDKGVNSLIAAAAAGDEKEVAALLDSGVDPDGLGDRRSGPALVAACVPGHLGVVKILISHGADVKKHCPLASAAITNQVEIAKYLLDHGANVNEAEGGGGAPLPLQTAASYGSNEMVNLLLDRGADIKANNVLVMPLHQAACGGHVETVAILLARGADINGRDSNGRTALDVAKHAHKWAVIDLLRAKGAKDDAPKPANP